MSAVSMGILTVDTDVKMRKFKEPFGTHAKYLWYYSI
jgi:hypothetical protein